MPVPVVSDPTCATFEPMELSEMLATNPYGYAFAAAVGLVIGVVAALWNGVSPGGTGLRAGLFIGMSAGFIVAFTALYAFSPLLDAV